VVVVETEKFLGHNWNHIASSEYKCLIYVAEIQELIVEAKLSITAVGFCTRFLFHLPLEHS